MKRIKGEEILKTPELTIKELKEIIPLIKNNANIILYSDLPYFYSANAVLGRKDIIIGNKEGDKFLILNKNNAVITTNEKPYSILKHKEELAKLGHKMFGIDFLYNTYTQSQIQSILRQI